MKKHVVYWGEGAGRMRLAFKAREPAEQYYVTMLAGDASTQLLEQTDAEASASGTIDLDAVIGGSTQLPRTGLDDVCEGQRRGAAAADKLAKDERDGSS